MTLPHLKCQLHDHAKQYDNDGACHSKQNGGKLHGNISRNGYANTIIVGMVAILRKGYGGCMIPVKGARY